ncbi:fungal Zn binuclear cluster domain-containing protein [Paraphoma chrysanthemicola]|nr:fungal Zn binuclear cluster domain-containing protein [Paraphoma chrysanthemicola]
MKRQRTKCFTGCWTCRSRRVKCDEETPSCRRCRQMGIACEGYGLRLNWIPYNPHDTADDDDTSQRPQQKVSRRALGSLSSFPPLAYLPSSVIDATLATIDEWYPGDPPRLEEGVFSVFPVYSSVAHRSETIQSSPRTSPDSFGTIVFANSPDDHYTFPVTETTSHDEDNTHDARDQSIHDFHGNTIHAFHPLQSFSRQGQAPLPRHLDALSMPSKQKRLIHHWITFTSRKLVLIDEPHNPCRTMMLPMALKGLVSGQEDSNAEVAIFHAICAAAAYNLFELTGQTNEQDRLLALYHDNEAVHHLRHNLTQAAEPQDQSFAMAIMACIAVEAVSGTTQRWRTHVSGGLAYLTKLQSHGSDEAAFSAFRQHMVKMAIMCDLTVSDNLKSFLYDESGSPPRLEFSFPYYGVSRSFLLAHDRINSLLMSPSAARTLTEEQELDAFELQLYLDFPSLPSFSMATDKTHDIVVHHTSKAFYYANLVYFQRNVRCIPVAAVQELVDLGLHELESIDRVGQGALGCLMLWPVLILGAECGTPNVHKRMKDWFRAQRTLGFRNLMVLEDLVVTVWEARASLSANKIETDWRQVILQARFDVFRL